MAETVSPLLRTGEFARAASVSVKALPVYHQMGLLVPKVVDPTTGYRAYAPSQLTDAAIIRLLREVGVSLQDIHTIVDPTEVSRRREPARHVLAVVGSPSLADLERFLVRSDALLHEAAVASAAVVTGSSALVTRRRSMTTAKT
jgi:DNA-binding transcriptional MerR regulator